MTNYWTKEKIKDWIFSQRWYQSIHVIDDIITPGNFDTSLRFKLMSLGDLSGKSILDVGCNSGQICFQAKKLGASEVVGIDINQFRLSQAKTLADIMNLDVEFNEMDILDSIKLGQFDIVFCISVLTEITDLISSLSILKKITKETLFLELAIAPFHNSPVFISKNYKIRRMKGKCYLRKIKGDRWVLMPNMKFIKTLLNDKFKIKKLGKSSRYTLLKCEVVK